ncbi:unnamed protein product [Hermetia illucens]|uniref:Protein sleepless n=1 Tax=Hermetia illucens TaxID=343691 RepID=A0A7R8YPU4_HERIL|nr:uncharacterized protein LOC119661647 [Hermetia illucens]CAD7079815.1 unnamed protein product [Hermetia illucens]
MQYVAIIGALFLTVAVQEGSAIRCYECNSHNDSRCALDIPPNDLSIECGNHKHGVTYTFCRKITQIIEFAVNNLPPDNRVIRTCGWDDSAYKNACYQRAGFGGRQEVCACSTDNCNGSTSIQGTLAIIGAALAATFLIFRTV